MSALTDIIAAAAQRYGQNPNFMLRVGQIESGLNPNAHNASGADGLFQLMPRTAASLGVTDTRDPVASADAGARLMAANAASLTRVLGRKPTDGEQYLAYQQGATGAAKLLTNPDAPAASIVGSKAVTSNGGSTNQTAGQFAQMWTGKFDGTSPTGGSATVGAAAPALPSIPVPSAPIPPALDASVFLPVNAATPDDTAAQANSQAAQARRVALLTSAQSLFAR